MLTFEKGLVRCWFGFFLEGSKEGRGRGGGVMEYKNIYIYNLLKSPSDCSYTKFPRSKRK